MFIHTDISYAKHKQVSFTFTPQISTVQTSIYKRRTCSPLPIITSSPRPASNRKKPRWWKIILATQVPVRTSHIAVIWDGKDLLSHPSDSLRTGGGFFSLQYADLLFNAFSNCKWQKWWGFPPLPRDGAAQCIIELSIRAWGLLRCLNHLCSDFHFHHSSCCPLGPH